MKLRVHRLAVVEIDHEVDYYEERQPGLGNELENEIDSALGRILRFPESAPQWKDRRTAGSPYSIDFRSRFPVKS